MSVGWNSRSWGGSREHKEGGRCSNNATDAKEEDAPGNQEVVEIDQDEKEETPLPNKALEVCHIHDNSDEWSPPSMREKSPISSRLNTCSP